MANIELKLKINELKEYFFLLSNFFDTLNYQLKVSKSNKFKNIEFKFVPEKCNTEFTLPIKLGGNFINSFDYGYAFKKHENKIYLVTLFGSFASSLTELKIEDLTNFVAKKLETSFKQSSDFYYSSISLSGLNEEINLNDSPLLYKLIPEDSKKVFEQFQNFDQSGRMSVELSVHFDKWYNDAFDNSTSPNATIYSSLTNLIYNTPSSYMITGTVVAISGFVYFSYCYFKNQKAQYEIALVDQAGNLLGNIINNNNLKPIIETASELTKQFYNQKVDVNQVNTNMKEFSGDDNEGDINQKETINEFNQETSFGKVKFRTALKNFLSSENFKNKYPAKIEDQNDFISFCLDKKNNFIARMFINKQSSSASDYQNVISKIFNDNSITMEKFFELKITDLALKTVQVNDLKSIVESNYKSLFLNEEQSKRLIKLELIRSDIANFKFSILTEMFKAKAQSFNAEIEKNHHNLNPLSDNYDSNDEGDLELTVTYPVAESPFLSSPQTNDAIQKNQNFCKKRDSVVRNLMDLLDNDESQINGEGGFNTVINDNNLFGEQENTALMSSDT